MSRERRTDDGTYPDVEEARTKNDARELGRETGVQVITDEALEETGPYVAVADAESAAREPLETERDDASRDELADEGDDADDIGGDERDIVRRAEVRLDPLYIEGPSAERMCLALEDYADGASEIVIYALDDRDAELELARIEAPVFFAGLDRLRAFAVDPSPPRERTAGDVNAALEGTIAKVAPILERALGVPPLRPVPGGRR